MPSKLPSRLRARKLRIYVVPAGETLRAVMEKLGGIRASQCVMVGTHDLGGGDQLVKLWHRSFDVVSEGAVIPTFDASGSVPVGKLSTASEMTVGISRGRLDG